MKNKFGRWSKEILWLERQNKKIFFSETRHFFLCFFLKTFKIKISTVWQARDLPESPKTLFRHVTSPSLKEKAKIKERNWRSCSIRVFVCFFFFFVTATLLLLFLSSSLSLISRRSAPGIVIFITFDVWFCPFSFHFCWMNGNCKKKKKNSKSKEFKTSFLFSLHFFLPLQTRSFHDFECQNAMNLFAFYYHFDSLFIWFEFKFLSFLQCSICLFWMIVSRIYCPMLLQLGRRLFRIALEKEN